LKRRDDHAGETLPMKSLEGLHLGAGKIAAGRHEGRVAARLGCRLDRTGERDRIGIDQIAGEDADDARALGLEHASVGVRHVLEPIDSFEDGAAGGGANVARIVQHSGDGAGRRTGELGDVEDGRVGHVCGNDCTWIGGCQRGLADWDAIVVCP
jgi:hypothetical protein